MISMISRFQENFENGMISADGNKLRFRKSTICYKNAMTDGTVE